MTESQADNLDVVADAEIPAPVEELSAPKDNDDKQEPVFNRKQVTDIVKRERAKAIEQGKRQAMMELQQQQEAPNNGGAEVAPQIQQQQAGSVGGMQQMSPDQVRQLIAQETPKALQDHVKGMQRQHLVDSFVSKMKAAEQKYPGMESKLNDLDYSTIEPLIKMANEMENTGDIMNELLENPMKMGNLVSLIYTQPKMAEKALHNLSNSIKQNVDADAKEKAIQDPFSQIKPSLSSGKDDGDMTVSDFRAMFKKSKRR